MPEQGNHCRHCGYSQPTDAATCPGCGRRHALVRREAPRQLPAIAGHLGLMGPARRSRWLLVITGWLAAAFAIAAATRFAFTFDDVAKEFADTTPGKVTDAMEGLGWAVVASLLVTVAVLSAWVHRSVANLPGLHLDEGWTSAWSLGGWAKPGRAAQVARRRVDLQWRDTSSAVAPLPHSTRHHWSRVPVSQVVLRWWALWLVVPAVAALLVVIVGESVETASDGQALMLTGVAAAALLVVAIRSAYDVIGIVTVAQAHRAEALLRERDTAVRTGTPRPAPEPLVVSDHEWLAAGYDPKTHRDQDEDDDDEEDGIDDVYDLSAFFAGN
jgi:hypothetical protein